MTLNAEKLTKFWFVNWVSDCILPTSGTGDYMYVFYRHFLTKYIIVTKPCSIFCLLASTFLYFLNCAVSSVYLSISDSDYRLIRLMNKKQRGQISGSFLPSNDITSRSEWPAIWRQNHPSVWEKRVYYHSNDKIQSKIYLMVTPAQQSSLATIPLTPVMKETSKFSIMSCLRLSDTSKVLQ